MRSIKNYQQYLKNKTTELAYLILIFLIFLAAYIYFAKSISKNHQNAYTYFDDQPFSVGKNFLRVLDLSSINNYGLDNLVYMDVPYPLLNLISSLPIQIQLFYSIVLMFAFIGMNKGNRITLLIFLGFNGSLQFMQNYLPKLGDHPVFSSDSTSIFYILKMNFLFIYTSFFHNNLDLSLIGAEPRNFALLILFISLHFDLNLFITRFLVFVAIGLAPISSFFYIIILFIIYFNKIGLRKYLKDLFIFAFILIIFIQLLFGATPFMIYTSVVLLLITLFSSKQIFSLVVNLDARVHILFQILFIFNFALFTSILMNNFIGMDFLYLSDLNQQIYYLNQRLIGISNAFFVFMLSVLLYRNFHFLLFKDSKSA